MKKYNGKNIWVNTRLLLILGGLIFLYDFTGKRNGERPIKRAEVAFSKGQSQFLTIQTVNKLLIENNRGVQSIHKENLDLNRLEQTVNAHPMVEKSEVFLSIDGVLKARVKQKTPVARITSANGSFYLDYQGNEMPLSEVRSARVPLVSGSIGSVSNKKLGELFRIIYRDDFLKKNIIGVEVLPNGDLLMENRNYRYKLDFGKPVNMKRKFANYEAFFQKASGDSLIARYKTINLKFTQQVVCTK